MARKRGINIEGLTSGGLTSGGLTKDGTYFKDGVEMVPTSGRLPERPRFLTLNDGILDRANQPKADLTLWSGWRIEALRRCNEADQMRPLKGRGALKELKARFK